MSSIVQWAIDALIEFHDIVRRDGRKLGHIFWLQDVHLDANEVFNSLTWEWVFLHDLRSNVSCFLFLTQVPYFCLSKVIFAILVYGALCSSPFTPAKRPLVGMFISSIHDILSYLIIMESTCLRIPLEMRFT